MGFALTPLVFSFGRSGASFAQGRPKSSSPFFLSNEVAFSLFAGFIRCPFRVQVLLIPRSGDDGARLAFLLPFRAARRSSPSRCYQRLLTLLLQRPLEFGSVFFLVFGQIT